MVNKNSKIEVTAVTSEWKKNWVQQSEEQLLVKCVLMGHGSSDSIFA